MIVHQLVNKFRGANTFIIEVCDDSVVLVDPGDPDISPLLNLLQEKKKKIMAAILTHEHADHCGGLINYHSSAPVYCSEATARNIGSSKQNLSLYIENTQPFEVKTQTTIVRDGETKQLGAVGFTFFKTPGHSPGSICIRTGTAIFTGDTLLNNSKTPLTFPHSNKKDYQASIERLKTIIDPGMTVYPGHGEPYVYSECLNLM